MADDATSKIDEAAEKAYAEASAKQASPKPAVKAEVAKPVETAEITQKVAAPAKKKAVIKKKVAAKKSPPKPVAAPAQKPAATQTAINIKDTIMATAKTADFTKTAKEMVADVQTKVKSAYAKTGELASEVTEFSKANAEAVVESGKILFSGLQELGREDIENSKDALETVTADVKKIAAAKTPTEFLQLQGELARRNFDAVVSFGSKRTEDLVKLYNDAFAPISSRVSIAAEKIKTVA